MGESEATPPSPRLCRLADLLPEWEADATARYEAKQTGSRLGPVSGLRRLDQELGDALQPGIHVVHGGAGTGKTAFCLQMAAECGCPAVFVSTEMSQLELTRRITARATKTFLGRLKSGELVPGESVGLLRQAVAAYPDLVLMDATRAFATPNFLRVSVEAARGDSLHVLLVIDSLHSWVDGMPGEAEEYIALNGGLAALRSLSARLECPIVIVAERNRASMEKGGISAGAGTRKIEYGAESVLDLKRDMDVQPDAWGDVPVTLTIRKNRNGAAGRPVKLKFHGALQRFQEE